MPGRIQHCRSIREKGYELLQKQAQRYSTTFYACGSLTRTSITGRRHLASQLWCNKNSAFRHKISLFWILESDDPPLKKCRSLSRKIDQSDDSDSSHNFHRDDPQIGVCLQYLRLVTRWFALTHSLPLHSVLHSIDIPLLCFLSFDIRLFLSSFVLMHS